MSRIRGRTTIAAIKARLEALRSAEIAAKEKRKAEIGELAERAGVLEIEDEVILGALVAASDPNEAGRFRQRWNSHGGRRRYRNRARSPAPSDPVDPSTVSARPS